MFFGPTKLPWLCGPAPVPNNEATESFTDFLPLRHPLVVQSKNVIAANNIDLQRNTRTIVLHRHDWQNDDQRCRATTQRIIEQSWRKLTDEAGYLALCSCLAWYSNSAYIMPLISTRFTTNKMVMQTMQTWPWHPAGGRYICIMQQANFKHSFDNTGYRYFEYPKLKYTPFSSYKSNCGFAKMQGNASSLCNT